MCTQSELNQILDKMLQVYNKVYGAAINAVYLYGSCARGEATPESDIDIVAIVKGARPELQEHLKQVWDVSADIGLDYEVVISPTVIPYEEFEDYKMILPYYRNILQEGVRISG